MKTNKWIFALAMGMTIIACTPKAEEAEAAAEDEATSEVAPQEPTAKDYLATKKQIDDVSYLVGVNFGSFIKGYNFGDLNFAQIRKGIEDFINAKGNMMDEDFVEQFRVNPNDMNELFNDYLENRHYYILYTNKEKEDKFLAANAKKEGVQQTESGLQYKIVNPGSEVKPALEDTVWVNYTGKLIDGTVFDEVKPGDEPVQMMLQYVVKGWQEGLQLIGEGGEIELYVPAALGYGESGTQGIEPNSTLIFNVSLDKVSKAEAAE